MFPEYTTCPSVVRHDLIIISTLSSITIFYVTDGGTLSFEKNHATNFKPLGRNDGYVFIGGKNYFVCIQLYLLTVKIQKPIYDLFWDRSPHIDWEAHSFPDIFYKTIESRRVELCSKTHNKASS
jgi:hypothetical protein